MTQINYAVGTTRLRDHIYWPTITPAELAVLGYTRSVGVTLDQIMALAWKVKKWSVTGGLVSAQFTLQTTGVINDDNGHFDYTRNTTYNSAFTIPSFDMPLYKGGPVLATDEKDILAIVGVSERYGFVGLRNGGFSGGINQFVNETASFNFTTVIVPPYPGPPPIPLSGSGSGTFSRLLQLPARLFGNETNAEYVVFDSSQFYPLLEMPCLLFPQYYGTLNFFADAIGTTSATLTVDPGVAPSFTVPLKVTAHQGALPLTLVSASVNVQMTATEFWDYA